MAFTGLLAGGDSSGSPLGLSPVEVEMPNNPKEPLPACAPESITIAEAIVKYGLPRTELIGDRESFRFSLLWYGEVALVCYSTSPDAPGRVIGRMAPATENDRYMSPREKKVNWRAWGVGSELPTMHRDRLDAISVLAINIGIGRDR